MIAYSAPNTNYLSSDFAFNALRSPQTFGILKTMEIGKVIRQIRKARGMTLEEVAGKIDADTGNLSRVERGLQNHTPEMIDKLAKVFGVKVSEMYAISEGADPAVMPAHTPAKPVNPVIADFAWTYNNVSVKGKDFLMRTIDAAKAGYLEERKGKSKKA